MANLQVKSIDEQLYQALGKRAAMENRSISQEVIHILKTYLTMPTNNHTQLNEQFLALCGSWDDEQSAEEITEQLRAERVRRTHREIDW